MPNSGIQSTIHPELFIMNLMLSDTKSHKDGVFSNNVTWSGNGMKKFRHNYCVVSGLNSFNTVLPSLPKSTPVMSRKVSYNQFTEEENLRPCLQFHKIRWEQTEGGGCSIRDLLSTILLPKASGEFGCPLCLNLYIVSNTDQPQLIYRC